ncbi:MAG: hypothetical protein IIV11_01580, partial [Clostridia bacterium]|nr:hypothetical protein [Clostridia bacterium]
MLFILIFSAIFCFFAGLFILFGALKGRKYKWHLSLARIIVALISAVAAAMLATFLSNLVIRLVLNLAITNGWFLEVGNILAELPTGVGVATALASMLVSPILFIPLFFIIKPILNIFGKLISRMIARASEKDENGRKIVKRKHYKKRNEALIAHYFNPLGAALGALCSLLVFCIALVPIVGAIDVVNDIVPLFSDTLMEEASEAEGATENAAMLDIAGTALAALNGLDNNVGALTIKYTGGKLLYGAMTTSVINGEMANLNKEGALLASVAEAAVIVLDEEEAPEEKAAAVRAVS